jgi:hypothetical protein
LVLPRELHVSMTFIIIQHYDVNFRYGVNMGNKNSIMGIEPTVRHSPF